MTPRMRIASSYGDIAQWPEWLCATCGEWKPGIAFERTRQGKVSASCRKCLKVTRQKRVRRT